MVEVKLSGFRIPIPGGAAKLRSPVVWRRAIWLGVLPDVPIALRVLPAGARFNEPGMLVGSVIGDIINDDFNSPAVRLCHQLVEGLQVAEHRMDVAVIGDII